MLDSGVRIAAAFLPVGVPVLVGLAVAVLRRRVLPGVAGPAIAGLFLQLLAVLASTFLVAEARLGLFGVDRDSLLTVSSVIGFAVIVLNVLSWTLLLVALFRRLPARTADRTPTGRHALLDEQGEQVIAEEGTTLLPVGAAAAGAGAGVGLGAAAAGSAPAETPPAAPHEEPWPEEPAVTETFAVEPTPAGPGPDRDAPHADSADSADLDREEPPAVTAESLHEAAETEDEAHGDVAETPDEDADADEARDEDEAPETTTLSTDLSTAEVEDAPAAGTTPADDVPAEVPAADVPADDVPDEVPADTTPDPDPDPEGELADGEPDDEPGDDTSVDDTIAEDAASDPADEEPPATDTLPAANTPGAGTAGRTPTSTGHPWFDPAVGAEQGATEPTRAGSTEGR